MILPIKHITTTFNHILLPVDFTANTDVAVKKAIELSEPNVTTIHLFHVQSMNSLNIATIDMYLKNSSGFYNINKKIASQLLGWRTAIKEKCKNITVEIEVVVKDNIEEAITHMAEKVSADLIILGKGSQHNWMPFLTTVSSNKLAEKTGCPVLTVKPGALHTKMKSVVIPIADFIPERKLNVITALCSKHRLRIHLVTILNQKAEVSKLSSPALVETFRYLKETLNCPVEYQVLHGTNRAKAVLHYAQKIGADMLLVNPQTETRLPSFMSRHIADVIMPQSNLQILAVKPNL